MKFATFITGPTPAQRKEFQRWFVQDIVSQLRSSAPTLRGSVYREVRDSPGTFFDSRNATREPNFGQCDILLETWFSAAEDFRRELLPLHAKFAEKSAHYASYHVTPRLQLDPRIAEAGVQGGRPEITAVCSIQWKRGMSREEASARYNRHAAIALRWQAAITKYEQDIVEEVIAWSGDIVPIDAFADFSFRTVSDCQMGLKASREEMQDTGGYVRAGHFIYLGDAQPIRL